MSGNEVGPAGVDRGVSSPVVRDTVSSDLRAIAVLHIDAFPDSVLARLGPDVMERYYDWQLSGPHDVVAIVAEVDGQPAGYLFGGVFRGSTIGFVKREKWLLFRSVLRHPGVLRSSLGWRRIALAGRLLARRPSPPAPEAPAAVPPRSFGVLAIAVDPRAQGRGVGRALMAETTARARAQGFERLHLSVHPDNEQALRFYRGLGFDALPEPDGTWSGRMTCGLGEAQPGASGRSTPSTSASKLEI